MKKETKKGFFGRLAAIYGMKRMKHIAAAFGISAMTASAVDIQDGRKNIKSLLVAIEVLSEMVPEKKRAAALKEITKRRAEIGLK